MENIRDVEKVAAAQEARAAHPHGSSVRADAVDSAMRRYLAAEVYREDRDGSSTAEGRDRPED